MKTITLGNASLQYLVVKLSCIFIVAGFLLCAGDGLAQLPPGYKGPPTNKPIASWSFLNPTTWTNDQGYTPISFTNLNYSVLGDGASLVVDTNLPAWLNFNVIEPSTGATNLVLNAPGSLTFWYAPGWATTNGGPGQWSELIDVGEWTTNSSYGYWGLSVDSAGSNLWFLAQDGAGSTYGLSTPISWTTNYFHYVALTYSSTNVSLYLDGQLATNDPGGLSVWPSSNAVAGGIYFGSDTNGFLQAGGLFDTVKTYSYPLASNTVQAIFGYYFGYYMINPNNRAMNIAPAPSTPTYTPTFDVITGLGNLQLVASNVSGCVDGMDAVWFTNVTAQATNGGMTSVKFTIRGGQPGYYYDVFATGALGNPLTNAVWVWLGQGQPCDTYTINITSANVFLILGTPQSTNGLTYAYLSLVAKVSPLGPQSDSYGVPYAWYAENGLVPITNGLAIQDPDGDALLNYQEYQYGTRPTVSEGFTIWSGIQSGTTSIP
jgi:hypothetical protein